MTPELVSCYCATYGRVHCLEESVESFLRQDYTGPKELVILNDYANQTIEFDHPEVKVFNLPWRIEPLGKKFNYTANLCSGDVLFCWEDDDIYLPNRISYSLKKIKDGVFHTSDGFFEISSGNIIKARNVFHATHAITKQLFDSINGYPEKDQCSIDVEFMQKINTKIQRAYSQDTNLEDAFYIYRWDTVKSYHGSGWGPEKIDVSKAVENIVDRQATSGEIPTGKIKLKPKWSYDYTKFVPRS